MKVIFEDHKNALLSRLFRECYPDSVKSNFIYAKGSGNILSEIKKISPNENIYIYIDSIPGNESIRKVWNYIAVEARQRGNIIMFPIVCSEYYFLKAFGDRSDKDINICVNKGNYFNSTAYLTDRKECRNFEKFCKYLTRHNLKDCMSLDSRSDLYEVFYTQDCLCKDSENACISMTLLEKSVRLIAQYECVPTGSNQSVKTNLSNSKIIDIHRDMVTEFNRFSDFLMNNDTRGTVNYFHIRHVK